MADERDESQHRIRNRLTLLKAFLTELQRKEDPEQIAQFVKTYLTPCRAALADVEQYLDSIKPVVR